MPTRCKARKGPQIPALIRLHPNSVTEPVAVVQSTASAQVFSTELVADYFAGILQN